MRVIKIPLMIGTGILGLLFLLTGFYSLTEIEVSDDIDAVYISLVLAGGLFYLCRIIYLNIKRFPLHTIEKDLYPNTVREILPNGLIVDITDGKLETKLGKYRKRISTRRHMLYVAIMFLGPYPVFLHPDYIYGEPPIPLIFGIFTMVIELFLFARYLGKDKDSDRIDAATVDDLERIKDTITFKDGMVIIDTFVIPPKSLNKIPLVLDFPVNGLKNLNILTKSQLIESVDFQLNPIQKFSLKIERMVRKTEYLFVLSLQEVNYSIKSENPEMEKIFEQHPYLILFSSQDRDQLVRIEQKLLSMK